MDHIVLRSADLAAAKELYGVQLGLRLALERTVAGQRMLFFRAFGVTLEVVEDASLSGEDALWGVAYCVRDAQAAHDRLTGQGAAVSALRDGRKPGTRVFTVRDNSCGTPTLMLQSAPESGA
jgi:predicted enzyme related to lactoylglutathione lyase